MWEGVPYQLGLRSNSAMSFLLYSDRTNGPPPTSGCPLTGSLANVLRPLPSPVAYCSQTWGGRIGVKPRSNRAVPDGCSYLATSVFGSVASTLVNDVTLPDHAPAGPGVYFMIMLKVHATSSAVSGSPSDHLASGTV